MATTPLIDLATLDLEQVIYGRDDLLAKLSQRGTFEMLGGIIHRDQEQGIIVGYKDIRGDDWWAADHIPGRPLFPGAMMIEASAQLCTFDYLLLSNADPSVFIGFGGVDKTRFRGTVEPEGRMYFVGKVNRIRRSLFTYNAQGYYRGKLVFESEIMGVVIS